MRKRLTLTAALAIGAVGPLLLAGVAQAAPVTPAAAAAAASKSDPDVYVAASSDTFGHVVVNPASKKAYLTVPSENRVDILNLAQGTYGKPIPVGSDPQGIDITPDGSTLLVADSGGQTISEVNLSTRKVTTVETPAGFDSERPYSIVALNNGHALFSTTFSGSGFGGEVFDLDLSTGAINEVSAIGTVTESTAMSRSGDYSTAAAVLGDDSGGPFDVYSASTGNVVTGQLNSFISSGALDGDGSTLLVDGIYVVDATTGTLLGTINGPSGSAVLTTAGTTGYVLSGSTITELNVSRFLTGSTISLPDAASGGSQLAISPNGKYLVAETSGGATIVKF
jgi:DNA-binding beta-propeller fold protein YncE